MAVANNAGDLTNVLFGNVPTTVFIIPLFYLLSEDPRIEQLIKEDRVENVGVRAAP